MKKPPPSSWALVINDSPFEPLIPEEAEIVEAHAALLDAYNKSRLATNHDVIRREFRQIVDRAADGDEDALAELGRWGGSADSFIGFRQISEEAKARRFYGGNGGRGRETLPMLARLRRVLQSFLDDYRDTRSRFAARVGLPAGAEDEVTQTADRYLEQIAELEKDLEHPQRFRIVAQELGIERVD